VVAPACVDWSLLEQALSCVLAHTRSMGSRKLSSIDRPLYFTDDIGIVFGPPRDYPFGFLCGRQH
jgi:hypothetical protein